MSACLFECNVIISRRRCVFVLVCMSTCACMTSVESEHHTHASTREDPCGARWRQLQCTTILTETRYTLRMTETTTTTTTNEDVIHHCSAQRACLNHTCSTHREISVAQCGNEMMTTPDAHTPFALLDVDSFVFISSFSCRFDR